MLSIKGREPFIRYLSIYISIYLLTCLSICIYIYLSFFTSFLFFRSNILANSNLTTYLSTYLPIYLSTYLLSNCLTIYYPGCRCGCLTHPPWSDSPLSSRRVGGRNGGSAGTLAATGPAPRRIKTTSPTTPSARALQSATSNETRSASPSRWTRSRALTRWSFLRRSWGWAWGRCPPGFRHIASASSSSTACPPRHCSPPLEVEKTA